MPRAAVRLTGCQPSLGARRNAAGGRLDDGRVLIVGGATATGTEADGAGGTGLG